MSVGELEGEIAAGSEFWGHEDDGKLIGVMGIQDRGDVVLIRHAYVQTAGRKSGIGTRLLSYLEELTCKPILTGTWSAASWAIRFYEKNGYTVLSREDTNRLLRLYWTIPERQVATSVVVPANDRWNRPGAGFTVPSEGAP